jgi:serine protease Do
VVLADVAPAGPAGKAGVKIGDIVLRLDGKVMENGRQLDVNVYRHAVDATGDLELLRGTQQLVLRGPVVERPNDPRRFMDMVRPEDNLIERLGILALDLDAQTATLLPPLRYQAGVMVAATGGGSPYPKEQFWPGDVIYSLNGKRLASLKDLRDAVAKLPSGESVVFRRQRDGHLTYVAFELE